MSRVPRWTVGSLCGVLLVAGCSSSGAKHSAGSGSTTLPKASAPAIAISALHVDPATERRCDPIGARCMLPFPNDHFTVADASTPTKRRLALVAASMPANKDGVHIDVTDQNRGDGWSPGSVIMAQFPGLDARQSRLPGIADDRNSVNATSPVAGVDAASPIVVLDATTGKTHPFWAEIDANADPGTTPLLMIHPAVNFADGHRIVVGMRNLVDTAGRPIAPTAAFAAYRDGLSAPPTPRSSSAVRRWNGSSPTSPARACGRADLQLAWDFTVASTKSLTGRMIAIRDDAFASLGKAAPDVHGHEGHRESE